MSERGPARPEDPRELPALDGWTTPEAAQRYARTRYASPRAAGRDPATLARLLDRHLRRQSSARVLDVPHGTGRLAPLLEARQLHWTGLDRSAAMLGEARALHGRPLVVGAIERLPFRDDSFDAVVCCRLLHHLDAERELPLALRELVRVSRELVLASFWDAGTLHAWRRRSGLRPDGGRRRALPKRRLERAFEEAGARIVAYAHGLRFVSMQTFAVARKQR
jgi:SAM-dependent methyltransferase